MGLKPRAKCVIPSLEVMMSDDSSKRVEKAFENIKEGAQEEELYFDPETGQLVVRNATSTALVTQDHLPATRMAQEGFFIG